MLTSRLVCVDPPRADCEELSNASDVRGAVALVVRGGCSFAQKARRIQAAGAIAMILANNTRDEPFAAFTMGESEEEAAMNCQEVPIVIPCVMMCLYDVRELFKQFPPTVKTGIMTLEIMDVENSGTIQLADGCKRQRQLVIQQQGSASDSNGDAVGGWGAIKRKTSSIMKLLDPQTLSKSPSQNSPRVTQESDDPALNTTSSMNGSSVQVGDDGHISSTISAKKPVAKEEPAMVQPPLFAFVQWATSASSYQYHYAPLSDFCLAGNNTIYEGKLVRCDPILADAAQIRNAHDLSDAIALVKRGACTFPTKLERIQRCGAVAAIVGNDDVRDPDAAFVMSVDQIKVGHVTIPSVMVSFTIFEQLIAENVAYARIMCLSGESAAAFMTNAGNSVSLTEVPMPSGGGVGGRKEALQLFHEASRQGDHGACQRILGENCVDDSERRELVKSCDVNHLTSLHHACVGGNEHVVSLLIRLGASVDAVDIAMQTPLHIACLHGHSSCVRRLVQAGAAQPAVGNIGSMTAKQNIGGSTPLHYAAAAGSTDCLEILLTVNARVDGDGKYSFEGVSLADNDGATPLHIACRNAHTDCAMYLIAANADLDVADASGYSPLRICCEMVNDPGYETASLHVIEKLVSAGATMRERSGEQGTISDSLVLDHVESKPLKRELEVMYLRYESRRSQRKFQTVEQENVVLKAQLSALRTEVQQLAAQNVSTLKEEAMRTTSLQAQQTQIEQLHVQMNTILQFLHSQNAGGGSLSGVATVPLHLPHNPSSDSKEKHVVGSSGNEETLAQEAALARDLGKKFCREQKFAIAEMYFEKSLELFPLPGVQRLFEQTKKLRHDAEQRRSSEAKHRARKNNQQICGKSKLLQEFRNTLSKSNAPEKVLRSIEREVSKLELLQEGSSEFEMARKWIEWLAMLPWGDPFSGLQNADLYLPNRDLFQQLHALEKEEQSRHLHRAAHKIQRAFREHYSVHLLRRSIALVRIQSVGRGFLARRKKQELQQKRHEASELGKTGHPHASCSSAFVDAGGNHEEGHPPVVDYSTRVDPAALARLRYARRTVVVAGVHFAQRPRALQQNPLHPSCGAPFHVLQLLRSTLADGVYEKCSGSPASSESSPSHLYFVWSRWGRSAGTKQTLSQCALSGPYEQLGVAQQRYERISREHQRSLALAPVPSLGNAPAMPSRLNSGEPMDVQEASNPCIQVSTQSA